MPSQVIVLFGNAARASLGQNFVFILLTWKLRCTRLSLNFVISCNFPVYLLTATCSQIILKIPCSYLHESWPVAVLRWGQGAQAPQIFEHSSSATGWINWFYSKFRLSVVASQMMRDQAPKNIFPRTATGHGTFRIPELCEACKSWPLTFVLLAWKQRGWFRVLWKLLTSLNFMRSSVLEFKATAGLSKVGKVVAMNVYLLETLYEHYDRQFVSHSGLHACSFWTRKAGPKKPL